MKGKYITTSLMLAVLAGGKNGVSVLVDETMASTGDHTPIWRKKNKNNQETLPKILDRDELKLA